MTGCGPSARRPILLLGKKGQIGWELERALAPLAPVVALSRRELDLTDTDAIRRRVRETAPGLIVNAAAYTAVDAAEEEPALAMAVNGTAPGQRPVAKRFGEKRERESQWRAVRTSWTDLMRCPW